MVDTYLPGFDACIRAARTRGVMCSYNAVDGTPMCTNSPKLKGLLRDKWGFDGYVVSDCNAVSGLVWGHRTAANDSAALAAAVKAGTDLLCDNMDTQKVRRAGGRGGAVAVARPWGAPWATAVAFVPLRPQPHALEPAPSRGAPPRPPSSPLPPGRGRGRQGRLP
jgi:hypothetical protein